MAEGGGQEGARAPAGAGGEGWVEGRQLGRQARDAVMVCLWSPVLCILDGLSLGAGHDSEAVKGCTKVCR